MHGCKHSCIFQECTGNTSTIACQFLFYILANWWLICLNVFDLLSSQLWFYLGVRLVDLLTFLLKIIHIVWNHLCFSMKSGRKYTIWAPLASCIGLKELPAFHRDSFFRKSTDQCKQLINQRPLVTDYTENHSSLKVSVTLISKLFAI